MQNSRTKKCRQSLHTTRAFIASCFGLRNFPDFSMPKQAHINAFYYVCEAECSAIGRVAIVVPTTSAPPAKALLNFTAQNYNNYFKHTNNSLIF